MRNTKEAIEMAGLDIRNRKVSCAQVDNIEGAIRQYESNGFTVRSRARPGCALLDSSDSSIYVCENPVGRAVASVSPHDEMEEMADAFWYEEPC